MEASRRGTELPLSEDPQLGTTNPKFNQAVLKGPAAGQIATWSVDFPTKSDKRHRIPQDLLALRKTQFPAKCVSGKTDVDTDGQLTYPRASFGRSQGLPITHPFPPHFLLPPPSASPTHLLVFAVSLLCNVLGLLELQLLDLHLLLVFHGPVFYHLHSPARSNLVITATHGTVPSRTSTHLLA